MINTTIEGLPDAINGILKEYEETVEKLTPKAVRKVANKCKRAIQNGAPRDSGEYASSWATKADKTSGGLTVTVYSKKPSLPHLLERGHVKKAPNGRVLGWTSGKAHIKPAEKQAIKDIESEIKKIL